MAISYSQYIDYLFSRSHGLGAPLSGTFELTARCNLDCKMCYIHKRAYDVEAKKAEISAREWLSYAEAAQKKGMLLLLLTGGEPLIRPDFREIYTGCRKLGILLSINTNGTMITDEMVELFKNDPPLRVNITLYGASPETYEKLCGDPKAYERAYHAVLALKKAGIRVKLNYSATPYNLADIPKVYAFARENNLMIQTASYMFPPVRACENGCCENERLTSAEAARARFDYETFRYGQDAEAYRKRLEVIHAGNVVPDDDSECQELPTERIRCRAGDTTFWMTYKAEMRPCGMMTIPSVDVRADGFDRAWESIRSARNEIMIPAKCTSCTMKNACELCPAVCYAENGDFQKTPEYVCEKTKSYLGLVKEYLDC